MWHTDGARVHARMTVSTRMTVPHTTSRISLISADTALATTTAYHTTMLATAMRVSTRRAVRILSTCNVMNNNIHNNNTSTTATSSHSNIHHHHHHHIHTLQSQYRHQFRYISTASASSSASDDSFVMNVPSMGDSITEGTIVNWLKKVGETVKDDEAFVVVETDKVSVDLTAPKGGVIEEMFAQKGDVIRVGNPLVKFRVGAGGAPPAASAAPAAPAAASKPAPTPAPAPVSAPPPTPTPVATPAQTASAPAPTVKSASKPAATPSAPAPVPGSRVDRRVAMTQIRKRIAERLLQSQQSTARLTTFNEIDMSKLFEMRAKYKDMFQQKYGQKLGFMSAFVAASTKALQEIPAVNASIDGKDIIYHDYVDVSIAIEAGIAGFADKAKNDSLTIEEMAGGTFTITNGGIFGSLLSTPIINMPQSAILGMHNVVKRPVVITNENKKDEIVIRPIMGVALSYDHRLIDGRESVTFLKSVKEKLEDPVRLLIGL